MRNLSAHAVGRLHFAQQRGRWGSQFLLTINGNDFRHDSTVNWNGSFVVTTFASAHRLFVIAAADIAQPGTVSVLVFNPPEGGTTFVSGGIGVVSTTACGGKTSNVVSFTITHDRAAGSVLSP